MVRIEWAGPAVGDLEEIHEFIARDSPRYARLTVERIQEAAARLTEFPRIGPILAEMPRSPYRQLCVGAYRIIYREDVPNQRVLIMGVIHGSRNLPPILRQRE